MQPHPHRAVVVVPGICGQAKEFSDVLDRAGSPKMIGIDYNETVSHGVDAAARHGLEVLCSHVDLQSPASRDNYVLMAQSAGGCVAHRMLDALLGTDEAQTLLPEPLRGLQLSPPYATVMIEPSMFETDVHGWAHEWAEMDGPGDEPEDWLREVLDSGSWTWPMIRGFSAGLVERCPDPSPQVETVRLCGEKTGRYCYICGQESAERNEPAQAALKHLAGVDFHIVEMAEHNVHIEQPGEVAKLLRHFLV